MSIDRWSSGGFYSESALPLGFPAVIGILHIYTISCFLPDGGLGTDLGKGFLLRAAGGQV